MGIIFRPDESNRCKDRKAVGIVLVSNDKTYPLFYGDGYYIYLYVRFKTKGDINWAPYARSDRNHYIIYRYKAVRTKKHDNFSFELAFDKVSIGEKLHK